MGNSSLPRSASRADVSKGSVLMVEVVLVFVEFTFVS